MNNSDSQLVNQLITLAKQLKAMEDKASSAFGAESHGFKFSRKRTESEIISFEEYHKIALPIEYRLFLIHVGDGGAGPAYGMLSLDEACTIDGHDESKVSMLSSSFPHTASYNPIDDPNYPQDETDLQYSSEVCGTLPICHEGCGYYHRLVVTGPTRGEIWLDGRVSDGGFERFGLSFLQWYWKWCNDLILGNDGVWWLRD